MAKNRTRPARIGIDIGKVLMAPIKNGKADTAFLNGTLERALKTPPAAGAFEGVTRLVEAFEGQAWLVSKAGPTVQHKTKEWLKHWDFYRKTGLPREHLRFCLRRPEKAGICRQLLIGHFIDDRLDVLEHLRGLVPHLYLFGEQPRLDEVPAWVTPVLDWAAAEKAVLEKMQSGENVSGGIQR